MGNILYSCVRLSVGTVYPAYRSFKAVKTRDIKVQLTILFFFLIITKSQSKEYVSWMTYWIVFSMVTLCEEMTDIVLSPWFPLYFEAKSIFLVWLAFPSTRGSVILYTKIVHPFLVRREDVIDRMLQNLMDQSYILGLRYLKCYKGLISASLKNH